MDYPFAYRHFFLHTHHLVLAIAIEHYYVVDVRAVEEECLLTLVRIYFQRSADEALVAVYIKFLGSLSHISCLDTIEIPYDSLARIGRSIFFLEMLKPPDSVLRKRCQIFSYGFDTSVVFSYGIVGRI